MFVIDAGSDELGAFPLHFREQVFPGFVDKRDPSQVNHRMGARRAVAGVLPRCAELLNPRTGQTAPKGPTETFGRVRITNSQHALPLRRSRNACRQPNQGSLILRYLTLQLAARRSRAFGTCRGFGTCWRYQAPVREMRIPSFCMRD